MPGTPAPASLWGGHGPDEGAGVVNHCSRSAHSVTHSAGVAVLDGVWLESGELAPGVASAAVTAADDPMDLQHGSS